MLSNVKKFPVKVHPPLTTAIIEDDFLVLKIPLGEISAKTIMRIGAPTMVLPRRQREVLGYVCQGLQNKEIADRLSVTTRTVKHHVSCLLGHFRVQTRHELIRLAGEKL